MAWLIGIDEAGYGPNLGPLVMSSVACRVAELRAVDLWAQLRQAVRRAEDEDDGRMVVADSKLVYSTTRGLADLEKSVLAALGTPITSSGQLVQRLNSSALGELQAESWYTGQTVLPIDSARADIPRERLGQCSADARVSWGLVRSVVVCAPRFNDMVDRWDSKGAVLGLGLVELIQANLAAAAEVSADEPIVFAVDKHGGRNHYAALLQHAFDEAMVVAREEGMNRSAYQVLGLERDVQISFEPRADTHHFCVALASMISKYLREVLMTEFNHFWQKHVPDLKPTAGYPGDAARYMDAIRPVTQKLGIPESRVWRCR